MSITTINIVMAFDFGTKKIGIAIGQTLTCTTRPLTVLQSTLGIPNWKKIDFVYNEWSPAIIIVGLPLRMDGSKQPITVLSRKFATQLKKRFQVTVQMHDERFSTVEARSFYLNNYNRPINIKKTEHINSIAAALILKSWLNQHKYQSN